MPKLTQAQVISLWLVAASKRSSLPPGDPQAIPLTDDVKLKNAAGIDVTQPDVAKARAFLIDPNNADDVANATSLFVGMIEDIDYDPPGCPPDAQLQANSKQPAA